MPGLMLKYMMRKFVIAKCFNEFNQAATLLVSPGTVDINLARMGCGLANFNNFDSGDF